MIELCPSDRRQWMRRCAASTLGVSFAGGLAFGRDDPSATAGPQSVIYLFMEGAMSHLDSFDPKTAVDAAGPTRSIATAVPGVHFGHRFERMATIADQFAIVRSLSTETGDHDQGQYWMRTGYKPLASIAHPAMGGWMLHTKGKRNPHLPGNYLIGRSGRHPGAGFLPPSISPVPIAKPQSGLANADLPRYVSPQLLDRRLSLAEQLDRSFQSAHSLPAIDAYNQLYRQARMLIGSEHLAAFDLDREPSPIRQQYGETKIGRGCLLARRLVQSGARFVDVAMGGWDMHQDLDAAMTTQAGELDRAVAALMADLNRTGLIEQTLVVLTTEFGRKPTINANAGRDHHPGAFSSLLAGAGIQTGGVLGSTDRIGHAVEDYPVSVADFNRTIAAAAGLPIDDEFTAPNGRPFRIGGDGDPIDDLLA